MINLSVDILVICIKFIILSATHNKVGIDNIIRLQIFFQKITQ